MPGARRIFKAPWRARQAGLQQRPLGGAGESAAAPFLTMPYAARLPANAISRLKCIMQVPVHNGESTAWTLRAVISVQGAEDLDAVAVDQQEGLLHQKLVVAAPV